MDLPDRGIAEWPADVGTAPLVAHVLALGPVIRPGLAVAVITAPPQLGVERVEQVGIERTDLFPTGERPDVLRRVPDVGAARGGLEFRELEVPIEHLVDRAAVRGCLRSSTWLKSRVRAASASAAARGPGEMTSTSSFRLPVSTSLPP